MQCRQLLDDAAAARAAHRCAIASLALTLSTLSPRPAMADGAVLFEAKCRRATPRRQRRRRSKTLDRAALTANNVDIETIVTMGKNQMPGFGAAAYESPKPVRTFGARLLDAEIARAERVDARADDGTVHNLEGDEELYRVSMRRDRARPLVPNASSSEAAVTRSPAALSAPRRTSISASSSDTSSAEPAATPSSESGVSGVRGRGGGGGRRRRARHLLRRRRRRRRASRASASAGRSSRPPRGAPPRRPAPHAACALACKSTRARVGAAHHQPGSS